jgi:hypothetical protein
MALPQVTTVESELGQEHVVDTSASIGNNELAQIPEVSRHNMKSLAGKMIPMSQFQ